MLLRLLEALLELANARLIAVFEVFYFIANFLDFSIVRADGRNGCDKSSADGGCQGDLPEHENLLWTKKNNAPRQSHGRQRRRSEEKRRCAAMESGNRPRIVKQELFDVLHPRALSMRIPIGLVSYPWKWLLSRPKPRPGLVSVAWTLRELPVGEVFVSGNCSSPTCPSVATPPS